MTTVSGLNGGGKTTRSLKISSPKKEVQDLEPDYVGDFYQDNAEEALAELDKAMRLYEIEKSEKKS